MEFKNQYATILSQETIDEINKEINREIEQNLINFTTNLREIKNTKILTEKKRKILESAIDLYRFDFNNNLSYFELINLIVLNNNLYNTVITNLKFMEFINKTRNMNIIGIYNTIEKLQDERDKLLKI